MLVSKKWVLLLFFSAVQDEQLEIRLSVAQLRSSSKHINGLLKVSTYSETFLVKNAHPMQADETPHLCAPSVELCRLFFVTLLLVLSMCKLSKCIKCACTASFICDKMKRLLDFF